MHEQQITVISILKLFYRFRFVALIVFILTIALGGYLFKSQPVRYKTTALLINESPQQQNAGFQSLALMAGISMSNTQSSTAFLADYINTPAFLKNLAVHKWNAPSIKSDSIFLDSLWRKTNKKYGFVACKSDSEKVDNITAHLESTKYLKFKEEKISGLFKLECEFEDPQVSYDVCNLAINIMNDWTANKRKSKARDTRVFLEKRLLSGKERLAQAENNLRQFKENNQVNTSPYNQLQDNRLARELQISQEIYIQLVKQYEIALTDEIKESNALEIMQEPVLLKHPTSPVKRNWALVIFGVALLLSLMSTIFADLILSFWALIFKSKK